MFDSSVPERGMWLNGTAIVRLILCNFIPFDRNYIRFMKQFLLILLFLIGGVSATFAQNNQNKQLKAYLDHKTFFAPSSGTYMEIQLQFVGYSLKYNAVPGGLQSEVAVQLSFRNAGKVVASDAYRLQSPVMRDSIIDDFYDLRRFALAPGVYEMEISLQDLHSDNPPMTGKQVVEVKDFSGKPAISDIQISEVMTTTDSIGIFTKSGYDMIPRISNYYTNDATKIPVYIELYHPESTTQSVGLRQTIKSDKNQQEVEGFTRFSKHEVKQVQPVIRVLDISKLLSGEYTLEYALISNNNEVLSTSSYYFERSNDLTETISEETVVLDPAFQQSITDDSVDYYMSSLIPISKPAEVKNIISILKKKNIEQCRKYIQAYWIKSATVDKPYEAWLKYKFQVQKVEKLYSNNFMSGFETDRGRVYLQYGPPNNIISREAAPSEYPYEIWQYDKIKIYSNKRFVFYNPDLVNNAYRLLHSDMVGELNNYRWQQQLAKRNSTNSNLDDPNDGNVDHFGGNSRRLYEQK